MNDGAKQFIAILIVFSTIIIGGKILIKGMVF